MLIENAVGFYYNGASADAIYFGSEQKWPSVPEITGWEIQLMFTGKKILNANTAWSNDPRRVAMGSPGTSSFQASTIENTGANTRNSFGDGQGLYPAIFEQTNITKVAFVDGSSNSLDPTSHDNYLIYDLVESTENESLMDILKRLDEYQRTAPAFHNNDNVWLQSSVVNHTAGINGYSGLLVDSGGVGFKTTNRNMPNDTPQIPDKFCVMGIDQVTDNDIQALCAFWGNLGPSSGKGDQWRSENPTQTFWSYWGTDFHSNSQTQRIGASVQSSPGVATGASWTGDVYLLAYSE